VGEAKRRTDLKVGHYRGRRGQGMETVQGRAVGFVVASL